MGSCASVHKWGAPDSVVKGSLHFRSKKADKLVTPESDFNIGVKSFDAYHGSKDEAFFDSRPWLDSDCEDDFFSVRGDFTPSCGSTPVHHSVSSTPTRTPTLPSMPEPSPTGQKKRLSELFRESRGEDMHQYVKDTDKKADSKPTLHELLPKSPQGTPYISGTNSVCSSERTPNPIFEREKPAKATQCCLPSIISCSSFREKKRMSPAVAITGKA